MDISVVRTEKKYGITHSKQSTLKSSLKNIMKPDINSGSDGYSVRSLYFDSIYDNDYFDKINGLETRKKIRLRIYSPEQKFVKLELKQKQGNAQKKESLIIGRDLAEKMITADYRGLSLLDSELAMRLYIMLETGLYRPKCIVEYKRFAFSEEINDIRITFDSDIKAGSCYDNFFDKEPNLICVRKEPVLEVKYNHFLLGYIKQGLDIADVPEISVSKYTMSREICGL